MSGPPPEGERRREARMPVGGLMNWKRGDIPLWGLLNDSADESVAFVAPGDNIPEIGERIEIERTGQPSRSFRVMRVVPFERTLMLVACASDWWD